MDDDGGMEKEVEHTDEEQTGGWENERESMNHLNVPSREDPAHLQSLVFH